MSFDDLDPLLRNVSSLFDPMVWAEEVIDAAQRRHPHAADQIGDSFLLLLPTVELRRMEPAYRSHCRELLDRVARGEDTRPATAAECCSALCGISLRTRLSTSATGLYARMWTQAHLPPGPLTESSEHYEAVAGPQIDAHEAFLRGKLHQAWRVPRRAQPTTTHARPPR